MTPNGSEPVRYRMCSVAETPRAMGRNVKALRIACGVTQTELAHAMRDRGTAWTQTTVWRLENGAKDIRASELVALADVFTVDIRALFSPELLRTLEEA